MLLLQRKVYQPMDAGLLWVMGRKNVENFFLNLSLFWTAMKNPTILSYSFGLRLFRMVILLLKSSISLYKIRELDYVSFSYHQNNASH